MATRARTARAYIGGIRLDSALRLIFSLPLSSAGNQATREKGECIFLHRRSGQYFCTYNIRLAGGVVSLQGVLPYNPGIQGLSR